jgi:hypothetical protein
MLYIVIIILASVFFGPMGFFGALLALWILEG